jgi:hypothetical protein
VSTTWRTLLGDYRDADALTRTLDVTIHTACAQHLLARELTVSGLFA